MYRRSRTSGARLGRVVPHSGVDEAAHRGAVDAAETAASIAAWFVTTAREARALGRASRRERVGNKARGSCGAVSRAPSARPGDELRWRRVRQP
jgi:hypothetical protein